VSRSSACTESIIVSRSSACTESIIVSRSSACTESIIVSRSSACTESIIVSRSSAWTGDPWSTVLFWWGGMVLKAGFIMTSWPLVMVAWDGPETFTRCLPHFVEPLYWIHSFHCLGIMSLDGWASCAVSILGYLQNSLVSTYMVFSYYEWYCRIFWLSY